MTRDSPHTMVTPGNHRPKRVTPFALATALTVSISACGMPDGAGAPCGEIAFECGGLDLVASAGGDIDALLETGRDTATVQLDASRSFSRQDLPLEFVWTSTLDDTELAVGRTPTVELSEGTHFIRLTVTDSAGVSATDDLRVTVSAATASRGILCGALDVSAVGILIAFFATMRFQQRTRPRR